jgi:gamma-glutamylcyclotransferase (GGCT)/AIG2-like uncharacterized protein YtfP
MANQSNKLFVYGTLRRGFPLHKHLHGGTAQFLGRGKMRGRLYDLGDFPGALPSPTNEIEGELYELTDAARQLKQLDEIEEFFPEQPGQSLFLRRLAEVELETGQKVRAWVYFLAKKPANARLVPSGDYAEARRSRS